MQGINYSRVGEYFLPDIKLSTRSAIVSKINVLLTGSEQLQLNNNGA